VFASLQPRSVRFSPLATNPSRHSRHSNKIRVTRAIFRPFVSAACALFHFSYPATPLLATLTKTPGVYPNSSHFGTSHQIPPPLAFSTTYKLPIFYLLSSHIHTCNGGGGGCDSQTIRTASAEESAQAATLLSPSSPRNANFRLEFLRGSCRIKMPTAPRQLPGRRQIQLFSRAEERSSARHR